MLSIQQLASFSTMQVSIFLLLWCCQFFALEDKGNEKLGIHVNKVLDKQELHDAHKNLQCFFISILLIKKQTWHKSMQQLLQASWKQHIERTINVLLTAWKTKTISSLLVGNDGWEEKDNDKMQCKNKEMMLMPFQGHGYSSSTPWSEAKKPLLA